MYDYFLSYTTREREIKAVLPFVDKLIDYLKREGYEPFPFFLDRAVLGRFDGPDDELWGALAVGILRSRCVLAVVSPGYLWSGWCRREWLLAREQSCALAMLWKAYDVPYCGGPIIGAVPADDFDWQEARALGIKDPGREPRLQDFYPEWSPMVPRPAHLQARRGGGVESMILELEPRDLVFTEVSRFVGSSPDPTAEPPEKYVQLAEQAIARVYGPGMPSVTEAYGWADRLFY
jgi:TIR domain